MKTERDIVYNIYILKHSQCLWKHKRNMLCRYDEYDINGNKAFSK